MKNKFLFILCLASFFIACKKSDVNTPEPPKGTATPLKLPLGATTGNAVTKEIGINGGTIQSADGVMKVTVPAGAIDAPVTFSIQPVKNTLGSKGLSYRLKPEGVNFKKPVSITYTYTAVDFGLIDPKYLCLAFQDADGYYYSAKNTKGNAADHTLTVQTTHFSDWTFYAMFDFFVSNGTVINGKIVLSEDESAEISIRRQETKPVDNSIDALLSPLYDPLLASAKWELLPKKGILDVRQTEGRAFYRAPKQIAADQELIVTAMINGDLGKDNLGNPVKQIQLSQPIQLKRGDYFILEENGAEMAATEMAGDLLEPWATQLTAKFPNGTHLSCYVYATTPGGYEYDQHGTPEKATLELVPADQKGYIVFRPKQCDGSSEGLTLSPGKFVLNSIASSAGKYFEGSFSATLFRFDYCQGGDTKTVTGKFRFKKTN